MSKLVRMLVSMAGADESYSPGEKRTVSDEVAEAWVAAGIAVLEDEPQKRTRKVNADAAQSGDTANTGTGDAGGSQSTLAG